MRSLFSRSRAGVRFLAPFLVVQLVFSLAPQALAETLEASLLPEEPVIVDPTFDPNHILEDRDILGVGDMTLLDIEVFLASRPGSLSRYRTRDVDGIERSAAEIIWRVATSYQVNPRYLLALLQKEQSLVDHPQPTQKQLDWATGYAICDNCSMNDPRLQEFRGFPSQLEWAAKQHRERYLIQLLTRGTTISGHAPGKTMTVSGRSVTPVNTATAMLYSYTPHIAGNLSLWKIWQRWFSLRFPEGTVVRGKTSGELYLLRNGERRPIKNASVAASLVDLDKIVVAEDARLSGYRVGSPVNFPNYALVKTPTDERYLLVGTTKRLIQRNAFGLFGFNEDELLEVSPEDIQTYTDGPDITRSTTYPTGLLVRDPAKVYWYIENNVRQRIPDVAFLTLYFRGRPAKNWTKAQIVAIPEGAPYGLKDGELVRGKSTPAVYVIEEGERRAIVSEADFLELGYQWKNVTVLPDRLLETYPIGMMVEPHAPLEPPESPAFQTAGVSASR